MWKIFGPPGLCRAARPTTLEAAVVDFMRRGTLGEWHARSTDDGPNRGAMGPLVWPSDLGVRTDIPNLRLLWRGHLIGFVEGIGFPAPGVCRVAHVATARDVATTLPPSRGKRRRGVGRKIVELFGQQVKARYGAVKIVFTETSQGNLATADYARFFAGIGAVGIAMKPGATPQDPPVPCRWALKL